MRHIQCDVDADAALFVSDALSAQIDRPAAVGVERDGRNALGDQLLCVLEASGQPGGRVRVHVDEPGTDGQSAGIDDAGRRGGRQPAHVDNASAADADVNRPPGIAAAIEHAPVTDEDVVARRL